MYLEDYTKEIEMVRDFTFTAPYGYSIETMKLSSGERFRLDACKELFYSGANGYFLWRLSKDSCRFIY